MPFTNVSIAGLESYQPAVDYRKSGRIGVLSGRNFAWDASGVYSAYSSRLIDGSDSIGLAPNIAQTIDLESEIHVGVEGKIWRLTASSEGSPIGNWVNIATIATLVNADVTQIPYNFRRWSSAYLGGEYYACAYNYGVFRVTLGGVPVYTRLTQGTVPGFPADSDPVIAIAETNGRMCYLTQTSFMWSGAANPDDLVPALGGAGFQILKERISGTPFAVTPLSQGAIIWTTDGALVAEFVGGDTVFRFWQLSTKSLPLSSFAITRMPDDDYIILTRLGLFMFNNLSQPQPITPLFNEYLREYLRFKATEKGHVWYSITDNRLYVGMRQAEVAFSETYALDIILDRWGVFSESHMGLFDYGTSRGQLAYATPQGIASFLLSPLDGRKNREDPNAPGTYLGLGSEITIGWIRAENLIPHADVVQELHEIVVNRQTPFGQVTVVYVDEGFITNLAGATNVDEGSILNIDTATIFDEGDVGDAPATVNYTLEVLTDLFTEEIDGVDLSVITPELLTQRENSDLWVTLAPAMYYRLRFVADSMNKFFRVNSLDMTVAYDGNLS